MEKFEKIHSLQRQWNEYESKRVHGGVSEIPTTSLFALGTELQTAAGILAIFPETTITRQWLLQKRNEIMDILHARKAKEDRNE